MELGNKRVEQKLGVKNFVSLVLLFSLSVLSLTSCALFGDRRRSDQRRPEEGEFVQSDANIEQSLRSTLRKHLEGNRKRMSPDVPPNDAPVTFSRPYYFKEIEIYPSSVDAAQIDIRETDSIIQPYAAVVRIPKVIFQTEFRRKRVDAEKDTSFYRHTGTETRYYILKNGRWTNVGSHFESTKVEEFANGQWTPVERKQKETFAVREEKEGVLGKIWSTVFGER